MAGFPPFWQLNNIPLCVCVYTLQAFYMFIIGRHLTCFPILAVAENVRVSSGVHAPLGNPAFRVHGEVELLSRTVALVLLCEEPPHCFQQWLHQDFHPSVFQRVLTLLLKCSSPLCPAKLGSEHSPAPLF